MCGRIVLDGGTEESGDQPGDKYASLLCLLEMETRLVALEKTTEGGSKLVDLFLRTVVPVPAEFDLNYFPAFGVSLVFGLLLHIPLERFFITISKLVATLLCEGSTHARDESVIKPAGVV